MKILKSWKKISPSIKIIEHNIKFSSLLALDNCAPNYLIIAQAVHMSSNTIPFISISSPIRSSVLVVAKVWHFQKPSKANMKSERVFKNVYTLVKWIHQAADFLYLKFSNEQPLMQHLSLLFTIRLFVRWQYRNAFHQHFIFKLVARLFRLKAFLKVLIIVTARYIIL